MNFPSIPVAFLVTLISILVLRPLARKLGLMDAPGGRKSHSKATPLIGGLGIFLGLFCGCLFSPEILAHYQPLLVISCLLLITGLVDDYYPLPAIARMAIQVVAAWLMCTVGENQLVTLGKLVGDWEMFLGRYTVIMTIFATVGVINAINMIDGMDGLSGGLVLICLVFVAVAATITGNNPALLSLAVILITSLVAFLLLNFRAPVKKPALIYLGDSGSTMLGFILAWILIEASQGFGERVIPATVALWFLAIPLMDTVYLFIARPLSGKSPFEPGTDHLHHLVVQRGTSRSKTVFILSIIAGVLGGSGLIFSFQTNLEPYSLYCFLLLFFIYIVFIRRRTTNTMVTVDKETD